MSYLNGARVCFHGRFQCDVSTINNFVSYYDDGHFQKVFQEMLESKNDKITATNGYWNPEGSGTFRLLGCQVSSTMIGNKTITDPTKDPLIGINVGGSDSQVAAKMVDLDPQQQMVSQIWGLIVRMYTATGEDLLSGEFEPAAFSNLWARQQGETHWLDQTLASAYQSVLSNVTFTNTINSPALKAIQDLCHDNTLSIRMNVLGFDRTPGANDYATGKLVGSIGPAFADTPKFFSLGRHLTPEYSDPYGMSPKTQVGPIEAVVNIEDKIVTADFGNALPTAGSSCELAPLSDKSLEFVILKDPSSAVGDTIDSSQYYSLGDIPFTGTDWFTTAGILTFDLNDLQLSWIEKHPLAAVKVSSQDPEQRVILSRESKDGLFLKADQFVYRMNPGDEAWIDLWTTQYGVRVAQDITLSHTQGMLGLTGTNSNIDKIVVPPQVCQPKGIVDIPHSVTTDDYGKTSVRFTTAACGPGNPRKFIDGQLYAIAYTLADGTGGSANTIQHSISMLLWDKYDIPEQPTWYQDVQPILQQYANLYPIMSKGLFDLANYEKVIQYIKIMELSFSLPLDNPNSMPVTRDMSANKRAMIIKWLNSKDPNTGLPYLGTPVEKEITSKAPSVMDDCDEPNTDQPGEKGGKYEFARKHLHQD